MSESDARPMETFDIDAVSFHNRLRFFQEENCGFKSNVPVRFGRGTDIQFTYHMAALIMP